MVCKSAVVKLLKIDLAIIGRISRAKKLLLAFLLCQVVIIIFGLPFDSSANHAVFRSIGLMFTFVVLQSFFSSGYGQYLFAWNMPYFPLLFTQPITLRHYVAAKVLLLVLITLLPSIVLVPVFWQSEVLYFYLCCLVYNIGFTPLVILYISLFNYKKINVYEKGVFANYQGSGNLQQFMGLLICIIPLVFAILAVAMGKSQWIFPGLLTVGLVALVLMPFCCLPIANSLQQKKYYFIKFSS